MKPRPTPAKPPTAHEAAEIQLLDHLDAAKKQAKSPFPPKTVKRYFVSQRTNYATYVSARRIADAVDKAKTDLRVRVRLRANGTFDVVVKLPVMVEVAS